MGFLVTGGASLLCSFGTAPCSLLIVPTTMVSVDQFAASIMDYVPYKNITGFAMCTSMANPAVASATSAASGVLTPQACTPAVAAPWAPGKPTVLLGNFPALTNESTCVCSFGGTITITYAGQVKVMM